MAKPFTLANFMRIYGYAKSELARIAHQEKYITFYIPKRNGGKRQIEAPSKPLKKLQRILAGLLDEWYVPLVPDCVHGYIGEHPLLGPGRGIRTNATVHLPHPHLLNLDLTDFFHTIGEDRVRAGLAALPQPLGRNFLDLLVDIALKEDRLPMGAPTSPVLSNICSVPLDQSLQAYCAAQGITYTRYADDMSFSASYDFVDDCEDDLVRIVEEAGFQLNHEKRKAYPPRSLRQVTGLNLIDGRLEVSDEFRTSITEHIEELRKLHWLNEALDGELPNVKAKLKHYERAVEGQLNFLRDIEGENDIDYHELKKAFLRADNIRPPSFDFYLG